jgi:hypothetical protein
LAFADDLRTEADGHGKPCFEICRMMVLHQSEPPSFLQAL